MINTYIDFAILAIFVYGYTLLSGRLKASPFGGAFCFLVIGMVLGSPLLNVLNFSVTGENLKLTAEFTLALILFSDAAKANLPALWKSAQLPIRLLGIGLPFTILLGGLVASRLFPAFSFSEAAILGIVLAPTDAALGQPVVSNPAVPEAIREDLSVESGLNDGICVPFLLSFLALSTAEATAGGGAGEGLKDFAALFLQQIGISTVVGLALTVVGVQLRDRCLRLGWIGADWRPLLAVALPVAAFCIAQTLGGSGFIACFVAGLAFDGFTRKDKDMELVAVEAGGDLLSLLTWMVFGAHVVSLALGHLTAASLLYAVLSLTVVRMLPVALATIGLGLDRPTTLFVGWFGPRGLASIVFAVMVLDQRLPHGNEIVTTVLLTVLLSVVAHGLSAPSLVRHYGR